ncbi:MAG TPA: tetratricopeptide repeat protein [Polyangia bacterium]
MQSNLVDLNPIKHPNRRTRQPAQVLALHLVLAAAIVAQALLSANPAQAASKRTDKREVEARQAFAAGQYQEALDLYARLYADKVHPTYLRNIGRCYQNLHQPDKAINAFRDYLRQAKDLAPAEKGEIDGYIAEMEAMKKQQEVAQMGSTIGAVQTQTAPPPATDPSVDPNASATNTLQLSNQVPEPPAQPTPFYKKGWFWGVVGVAVVGGVVGGLYAAGTFSKSSIGCSAPAGCY